MPIPLLVPAMIALGLAAAASESPKKETPHWSVDIDPDQFDNAFEGDYGWVTIYFDDRMVLGEVTRQRTRYEDGPLIEQIRVGRIFGRDVQKWFDDRIVILEHIRDLLTTTPENEERHEEQREKAYQQLKRLESNFQNDQGTEGLRKVLTPEEFIANQKKELGKDDDQIIAMLLEEGINVFADDTYEVVLGSDQEKETFIANWLWQQLEKEPLIDQVTIPTKEMEEMRALLGEKSSGIKLLLGPDYDFDDEDVQDLVEKYQLTDGGLEPLPGFEELDDENSKMTVLYLWR